MADWEMTAEDYAELWNEWYEDYGIGEFIEYSEENWEKVQKLDPRLVWTNHSTCEDDRVTAGATVYSNSCCWGTHGWFIASKPWEGDIDNHYESYNATAYLPCPVCNEDGEGEGEEGCKGPETPAGADRSDCDLGFINWYFD